MNDSYEQLSINNYQASYYDWFQSGYFILGKFTSGHYKFAKIEVPMEVTLQVNDDFFELKIFTKPQRNFSVSFKQRKGIWIEAKISGNYLQIPRFERNTCDLVIHVGFDQEQKSAKNAPALDTIFRNLPLGKNLKLITQMLNNKILVGTNNSDHLLELMEQIENLQDKEVENLF